MKALIHGSRVSQLHETGFPVAAPLEWVDAPEGVTTAHTYVDGDFVPPVDPEPAPELDPVAKFVAFLADNPDVAALIKG